MGLLDDPRLFRRAQAGIFGIESASGDYGALGPPVFDRYGRSRGRAHGLYQVMPENIGPWTEQHYGRRLTGPEFLSNQEAQDAVFRGQFGGVLEREGPENAASRWFSGQPAAGNIANDRYMDVPTYISRFMNVWNNPNEPRGPGESRRQRDPTMENYFGLPPRQLYQTDNSEEQPAPFREEYPSYPEPTTQSSADPTFMPDMPGVAPPTNAVPIPGRRPRPQVNDREPQPNWIDSLANNPFFMMGIAILGGPHQGWGPAAVNAVSGMQERQMKLQEYQQQIKQRQEARRVWRSAFPGGEADPQHPLIVGLPPGMAATVYGMGPETGLPALQRFQMQRAQLAEQERLRTERQNQLLRLWDAPAAPGAPPAGGQPPPAGGQPPPVGTTPPPANAPPPNAPAAPAPTAAARPAPAAEPTVIIGNRRMPLSAARALAVKLDISGNRSEDLAAAIAAAEAKQRADEAAARPPEAVRTEAYNIDRAHQGISQALDRYMAAVADTQGTSWMSQTHRDAIGRARSMFALQMKDFEKLGALSGADLDLINSLIPEARGITFGGPMGMVPTFHNTADIQNRVRAAVEQVKQMLTERRNTAVSRIGLPPTGGVAPPGGGSQANPLNLQR